MKKSIILISIFFAVLAMSSCKKKKITSETSLPPISQEGKNTFGFMLGNEVWVPGNFISLGYPSLSASYTTVYGINMVCRRISPIASTSRDDLYFKFLTPNLSVGTYNLDHSNSEIILSVLQRDGSNKEFLLHNNGQLTISRFDLANNIVSGTFSFEAKEETKGEIVKVTQGRFDVQLK